MLVPRDGGGQPVVVAAEELRRLAKAARRARSDVDHALSRIAGIMGPLDRRGWNAGAADGAWSSARAGLLNLEADLEQHAAILDGRADLVDRFETDQLSGDVARDDAGGLTHQVELMADGTPSADSPDGWERIEPWSIVPSAGDPYAVEVALEREQVEQFLSQVDGIDLTNRQGDPGHIALSGLKFFLSAMGDAPSDCNDAFMRLAQAVRSGPDAVRDIQDALQRSRPGCFLSRSQMRLVGVMADGTPVDIQAESTLDQFAMQMTAMVDQLAGHASGARRVPVPDVAEPQAVGPGRWVRPNRNGVSQRALDYQSRVTGSPLGYEYELNAVQFDGYDAFSGSLLEAKGERYAYLLDPKNAKWSTAADGVVKEALRHLQAAEGRRIIWYVAEQAAADRITALFAESDIEGIVVEYKP